MTKTTAIMMEEKVMKTSDRSKQYGNPAPRYWMRLAAPMVSIFALIPTAHAQSGLEEIVVTAQKRGAQSLQDVPASIRALSASELSSSSAQGLFDIGPKIPGFAVFDAGNNRKKIKIRGVSSSTESEPQETVGVYIDDVTITNAGGTNNENGASPDLNLFDLERIEVLKGPQGTLYGAGSMGGTVRYITKLPDANQFEVNLRGRLSTTKSGGESYSGDAMINAPLVEDKVALRVVMSAGHTGGFIDNTVDLVGPGFGPSQKVPGRKDFNTDNSWSVRANLMADLSEDLRVQLKYMRREFRVKGTSSVITGNHLTTENYIEPFNRDKVDIFNAVIDYDLGPATITSSTSYFKRWNLDRQDTTAFMDIVFGTLDPSSQLLNRNKYDDFTEELRIASNGEGKLNYVLGVYYSKLDKNFIQDAPYEGINDFFGATVVNEFPALLLDGVFPNVFQSDVDQDLRQVSLFGEVTLDITEEFSLTAGGRYFDVKQNFVFDGNPLSAFIAPGATFRAGSSKENGFNPKITASFRASETLLVYTTASKGYRVGGFNQPIPNTPECAAELDELNLTNSPVSFDSDSLWSYEAGAKAELADKRVLLNASAYKIDWKNIQLRKQLFCGFTFFDNVTSANIYGLEADVTALVTDDLEITLNAGYTDAKLGETVPLFGAKGDRLAGVPKFSGSAAVQYRFPLAQSFDGWVRADVSYVGRYNSLVDTADPANRQAGKYTLVGLRAGADAMDDNWSVQLFVNNLFNKIATTGTYNAVFGDYEYRNRPREIGVVASTNF
ncbi:MAG: TonB-dependent receptor [Sphingomonadales bacterium]|nr:TonB-dependent receptor [Sphingomonadales bacterium]